MFDTKPEMELGFQRAPFKRLDCFSLKSALPSGTHFDQRDAYKRKSKSSSKVQFRPIANYRSRIHVVSLRPTRSTFEFLKRI